MVSADHKKEAYRRLFLDEAGGLRPGGLIIISDLLDYSGFFKARNLPTEAITLGALEGGRQVVRHILQMSGAGGQILRALLEADKEGEKDV